MQRRAIFCCLLVMCVFRALFAVAQEQDRASLTAKNAPGAAARRMAEKGGATANDSPASATALSEKERAAVEAELRVEGEKRFRTNCGRCHTAPHKFPPRVMATAIRHMRVRATLTDEDMRLILRYMTQ